MPGDGNRDTWRHCHKGAEPPACGVVYFQLAMLSALLNSFGILFEAYFIFLAMVVHTHT